MKNSAERPLNSIAAIGNYLPRRCGIATFTTDLCEAIATELKNNGNVYTLAMNDIPEGYRYPDRVRMEIRANIINDYTMAADFLNINIPDVVLVQHEFGIFGGPSGAYLMRLLMELKMPIITTLHTVLKEPNDEQRNVMAELVRISERLVVMSYHGYDMLLNIYKTPKEKVLYIPHGIPDVPFVDPNFYKDNFDVEGRRVILTFGLLSPGKGIEIVLDAMPDVIKKYPDVVYIILGATHPHVKRRHGEEYRYSLQQKVIQHNIQDNVIFVDRFVSLEELCSFIGAADIYVTPYHNKEQIVSGTLAYTLGAGKAIISTPYWYAEEMLNDGRGVIVPFRDTEAFGAKICELFEKETERHLMRKRAYQFSRDMIWREVAKSYISLFRQVIAERAKEPHPTKIYVTRFPNKWEIPEVDLRHLRTLTDDTGILQHAIHSTPDRRHGYCTDDNARALIVSLMYYSLWEDESVLPLMQTYLAYLINAFNEKRKRFRNFMSYDRKWVEEVGSEDSHCRALCALGMGVAFAPNNSLRGLCARLFVEALPTVETFKSPRALAVAIVGIHYYLRKFSGDAVVKRYRELFSRRIQERFDTYTSPNWPWLEESVAYCNARIPHALLLSGQWLPDSRMIETGLRTLEWLIHIQTGEEGQLSIIGNDGWFTISGHRARFDQQPIEAALIIEACLEAFNITRENKWLDEAKKCLDWFLGRNDLKVQIYDFTTAGCRDGLHPNGVNENQGAESTLAWLMSLLSINQVYGRSFRTDLQNKSSEKAEQEENLEKAVVSESSEKNDNGDGSSSSVEEEITSGTVNEKDDIGKINEKDI